MTEMLIGDDAEGSTFANFAINGVEADVDLGVGLDVIGIVSGYWGEAGMKVTIDAIFGGKVVLEIAEVDVGVAVVIEEVEVKIKRAIAMVVVDTTFLFIAVVGTVLSVCQWNACCGDNRKLE